MTNEQHNAYLSWVFIGHGAFQVLMGLLMIGFFAMFFFIPDQPGPGGPPPAFFAIMFLFVFVFLVAFALPSFIAAYGLRKKKSWARLASIIAAVVSAMNVPIGTAACVYALWFFLDENWKNVYPEVAFANEEKARIPQIEREARWTGHQTDEKGKCTFHTVEPPDWR
ncbi:MAG: hypothetical protein ABL999_03790 [Pyrinomonadaceae bacterium]